MKTARTRALPGAMAAAMVLLLAVGGLAACRPRPRPPGTTTTTTSSGGPPPTGRYVDEVFEAEQVATDEVFRTAQEAPGLGTAAKDLKLNVYVPKGDTATKRPVMLWQFGGAWAIGDRNQMNSSAMSSARRGFVGVTIDYRISPNSIAQPGILDEVLVDVNAALDWLVARADRFKLDPKAIVSGGISAGAINSVHLITRAPSVSAIRVAGVVSLSGTSWPGSPAPKPGQPPIIMFSGRSDNIVSYAGQTQFCQQYNAAGNTCVQYSYDGGHGAGSADAPTKYPQFVLEKMLRPLGY
jgi:acetyl esterase/lipase